MKAQKTGISIVLSLALALPLALACGDEATVIGAAPATAGSTGVGSGGVGGSAGTDVGAGGGGQAACVESPTAPEDYLVRCTNSACRPFDNVARLSLYRAGEPLPEVP